MDNVNLLKILERIDPASCDYQEWVNVGMALKHEGFSVSDWDSWSRSDVRRYHSGECQSKWESFNGSSCPVTAGTVVQMAKDRGFTFDSEEFKEFDWDGEILYETGNPFIVNNGEGIPFKEPENWNPVQQLITYLETLFEAGENVGYVTETWSSEKDGKVKYQPTKGACDRTAGELISLLNGCGGDIGAVIGDYKPEAGAWIRFNPLDGKGVKNENVTDYRYALVESDNMPLEQQNAVIRELELPVAALVYSGGKSIHAIVKIDAPDYDEYRKRVEYLYKVCKANGFEIDKQNRNPSRLSRMPGVERNGRKQFIIDRNIGRESFEEWKDYIESINDDLPDPENLADVWNGLPELSPPLISGVLRQGHKMLIAGPSKAGKSYALIELCIAIAEGGKWLGSFECTKGRVMYVNLELDKASCLHRFYDVYKALGIPGSNISSIDIWNLRGHSVPMDKLAPKLIRRAGKRDYIAIVIDPIYKVITGDENSADQMAHFCNQFDKVCTELGCAVIYCHHHSKGAQGGKRSMDRASGSGVFARDPDALIDLAELEIPDSLYKQQEDKAVCEISLNWLKRFNKDMFCSQDDMYSPSKILDTARDNLMNKSYKLMLEDIEKAKKAVRGRTAWRIEGTLREFPKFAPLNLWFDYPVHKADEIGVLNDCTIEGENSWQKNFSKKRSTEERKSERKESLETAFSGVAENGKCAISELADYLGVSEKTVRRRIKEHGGFWVDGNETGLKDKDKIG
ncbi:AAA family ATPase [Ruminococcus sp. Marseille-P6503]|uniref:AAA family ATPase n=1 Tax=Ruminococcus sp. Marseille-P6503 TaxID=2364796 RepID=UPI000F53478C|nr:AAA family ATPase [Ruminococcus sp. Marseille-P6503]